MNETGKRIDFYDVGYPTQRGPCGCFSGAFDIDRNGNVEAFTVTGIGQGDKDLRFDVPFGKNQLLGDDHFAKVMAGQIQEAYREQIKDAMWEMDFAAREQEFEHQEAAE